MNWGIEQDWNMSILFSPKQSIIWHDTIQDKVPTHTIWDWLLQLRYDHCQLTLFAGWATLLGLEIWRSASIRKGFGELRADRTFDRFLNLDS
jgi:hypothetical protein